MLIPEYVHGISFCPNYMLCCCLGFSWMIYPLVMVEDDGTCNSTGGYAIKKSVCDSLCGLWSMSILFSPLDLNGHKKKRKKKKVWPRFFIEVLPIPISLILAKMKSFEKTVLCSSSS